MKGSLFAGAVMLASSLLLAGCETATVQPQAAEESNLVQSSEDAATALVNQLGPNLRPDQPLIVASFVNVDHLDESSTLGRMLAEQMASSLTRQGLPVVELKLRDSLFIQEGSGEFMLSRELQHISQSHQAQAVVVGTYAIGRQSVYVTSRLVRVADNRILAASDYRLPMDADVRALVGAKRR